MEEIGPRLVGALFFAICVGSALRIVVRPSSHLASRLRPYTASSRSALGRSSDRAVSLGGDAVVTPHGVIQRLYRPLVEAVAGSVLKIFGSAFDDTSLSLRLKQANVMADVPEASRAHEYRIRQVGSALAWGAGGAFVVTVIRGAPALSILVFGIGTFFGATRKGADVGKKIERRRERMRVELYTINQLLAIYLRTSGSPVLAAQRLVRRGRGAVIDELNEALRLHARGMSSAKAFERISEQTPEPFAARTYKLLSSGSERGADLANALLSLSEDVRDHMRTSVRRTATKRQAAMLLPIIAFLAPVMLLFIAGPLPSLIFSSVR